MDKYTKFILTVIAVALIGILFKVEINKPAHAVALHYHSFSEVSHLTAYIKDIVEDCEAYETADGYGIECP